jgi:hypothetical protein
VKANAKGNQKKRVEEKHSRTFYPSAHAVGAHGIGSNRNDGAQAKVGSRHKDGSLRAIPEHQRQKRNKGECSENVGVRKYGVCLEPVIQLGQIGRCTGGAASVQRKKPSDYDCHSYRNAEPKPRAKNQRSSGWHPDTLRFHFFTTHRKLLQKNDLSEALGGVYQWSRIREGDRRGASFCAY